MPIQELDKNFKIETDITEPDLVWINAREYPFSIHGLIYDQVEEKYLRLPQEIAQTISTGVTELNTNTSGGRVRFRTDSSYIAIRAFMNPSEGMPHMPRTGQSGFDLYRNVDNKELYFGTFVPPSRWEDGYSSGTKTFGELTDYTINFPLYDGVRELYIGIKKDAILKAASPYRIDIPVVFYGNSITQGGCVSRPGNSYPGFLSRYYSMDFLNLGFSGNGCGEKAMAQYLSEMRMSVLVMDYDSNAPSEEHLRETHYCFYKIVRDANPELPIIMISHPAALHGVYYCMKASRDWGKLENRRDIILDTYNRAREAGDKNIYFVDGKDVFAGEEWDACTVDGVHPNDFGSYRFAKRLEKILTPILENK